MSTFRPEGIGDIPVGLNKGHRDFLQKIKNAIEILIGDRQNVLEVSGTTPGSQAVTFDDLANIDLGETNSVIDSDIINWVIALEG